MEDIFIKVPTWFNALSLVRSYEEDGWEICFTDRNGTAVLEKEWKRVYIKPEKAPLQTTTTRYAGSRYFITIAGVNRRGEQIEVEFTRSEGPVADVWYKNGNTDRILKNWWSVRTYVTLPDGSMCGKYNPTFMPGKCALNFDFVLEATAMNLRFILAKIEEMAFHST